MEDKQITEAKKILSDLLYALSAYDQIVIKTCETISQGIKKIIIKPIKSEETL